VELAVQGEYRLNAPRTTVWQALNDPEVLQACIPGCEQIVKQSDTEIEARINAALGPVRSTFATRIELQDLNPPASYTIVGEGKAAAGFGKGTAKVELAEDGAVTVLRYTADMKLGGKLAQVGSRLLEGATRQLADQFFDAFAKRLDAAAVRVAAPAPEGEAAAKGGAGAWPWIVAAALAAAALAWWLARR
jgi:carbon monoxide dehydrogenase subunit G